MIGKPVDNDQETMATFKNDQGVPNQGCSRQVSLNSTVCLAYRCKVQSLVLKILHFMPDGDGARL